MEAAVVISVLKTLGPKILAFLQEKHDQWRDLAPDIQNILNELGMIAAAIEDHHQRSWRWSDGTNDADERWIQRVRDLAYSMQDCLDSFLPRVKGGGLKTMLVQTKFAKKIRKLRKESEDVSRLREKYTGGGQASTSGASPPTSEVPEPHTPAADLVGIDVPRDELLELMREDEGKPKQLKVISIVGLRGLGKTVLARQVYDSVTVGEEYEPRVWVRASEKGAGDVLSEILWQVHDGYCDNLSECLRSKRFLIVIDDMRTEYWNTIKNALPKNMAVSSRVIVTTAIQSIANACSADNGHVYVMRTLDEEHSKRLFFKETCWEYYAPAEQVLKKCDGLPLALVTTAQFLQRKCQLTPGGCANLCRYLGEHVENEETLARMKHALLQSYYSLPSHVLKVLLLYLGIFPSGRPVRRKRLIRRWLAEGFVEADHVAMDNFKELMNRSIIQHVDMSNNTEAKTCRTHGMVIEFILQKSMCENFITLLYDQARLPDKIRWLSLHHNGAADRLKTIDLSLVRSLTIFGKADEHVLEFSKYELLRVLDLEECETLNDKHVKNICNLLRLRYLSLGGNITMLPKQISKLKFLETLDVRSARVNKILPIPIEVIKLPCLIHLLGAFSFPDVGKEMKKLQTFLSEKSKLETLAGFVADQSPAFPQLMSHMNSLKKVKVWCEPTADGSNSFTHLSGPLQKFIQRGTKVMDGRSLSLSFEGCSQDFLDFRHEDNCCYLSLRSLKLHGELQRLPPFVTKLGSVTELCLSSPDQLRGDVLAALSNVRGLHYLKLITRQLDRFVIKQGELKNLRRLCIEVQSMACLENQEGALPQLESLWLLCKGLNGLCGAEIEHLTRLKEVALDDGVTEKTKEEWKEAAKKHLKQPRVSLVERKDVDQNRMQMGVGSEPRDQVSESRAAPSPEGHQTRISTLSESSSRLPVGDIKKVGSKPAIMTEDAMVSAFTGAMNSLLVKLATLLGEQYAKLTAGTRKEFMILKDELDAMKTLLEQLAGMAELSAQMRDSRNQMREMTYDIEDCIDDLMVHNVTTLSNDLILMLQNFTDQINKLKAQLEEADLGSMVPRTEMRSFGPSYMSREQWLSFDKGNGLVGMDGPRDELVRWLGGDEQDKQLQGVCILGVAGIGKTMLATQVYNQIKRRFERCVFISASKKVDTARLCRSILRQLQETINSNRRNDVNDLIDRVRTNLQDKRFLIVIDGVWSAQIVEDIIIYALSENNLGSRIITTSGISDVAESCGKHFSSFIYRMKPLTFEESLGLFRSIIFGSGRSCPVASEKVDEEIVKACGGIPLALRLIAGALASKPAEMEQWVTFREKIMKQAGTDDHLNVEWMRKIFDISYSDLSCDMKTCLLYLSAFPENHVIRKDRLIRRWVAEGFLLKVCGKTWWETGESYFLELVARNLVNPVYDEEDVLPIARNLVKPVYDEEDVLPIGCKVSGSVHDFITSLSSEENFVKSDVTDPTCMQHGVFRRLSVDLGSDNLEKPLDLFQGALSSKVRSLTFVNDIGFGWMPDLSAFKHVWVLDLKDNKRLKNEQLESIGRLSLLRYLGLGGTSVTELPQQIMALEQLTTLDIRRTRVRKLPAFRDTKLVFLLADELIILRGMGGMQKLEELSEVLMGPDGSFADVVAGLVNKLRRLRMLGVRFSRWYAQAQNETHFLEVKHFVEEVGKSNLQSLFLDNYPHHLLHLLADSWAHKRPHHLREIELRIPGCLPLVPEEMASLIALTHLHINVQVVGAQDVRALGNLPNLVLLKLVCSDTGVPRLAVSSMDGFQCLKVFCYWSGGGGMGLQFEAGAMPQLRRLVLDFNVRETISKYGDFDFGVQHLSYLVQVRATVDCTSATPWHVEAAEANMRDQVSQNPNHPVLVFLIPKLADLQMDNVSDNASEMPADLPWQLLEEITNGFSEEREIGRGGYGVVYKGVHTNGEEIAVKKFFQRPLDDKQFQNELQKLTILRHQNIVRLVGKSYAERERLVEHEGKLLYATEIDRAICLEYLDNGSLEKHLCDEYPGLSWHCRYKIIKGICDGLKYLHGHGIFHLDLKPANILLDKNMVPKIADFNLSRLFSGTRQSHTTSKFIGTRGYMPPEYINQGKISEKFDVFSLGVIIIRMMTGPEGYSQQSDMSSQDFIEQVLENWRNRPQEQLKDELYLDVFCQQVKICIEIALNCVETDRHKRPSIKDIISKLNESETMIEKSDKIYKRKATPYEEGADLVIDGRTSEFIEKLANDGDEQLKVVSVVGSGGIGKTTLARVLYNKLRGQFDCRAFVKMNQNPDIKIVVHDMLTQLQRNDQAHDDCHDLSHISKIREYLQDKRYLIIVDDLWAAPVWDIINNGFPEGSRRSRIIITTQIDDVALACCCYHSENVFQMKPLDVDHSRKLFFNRFGCSESDCPQEFKEISYKIVEKCGGFPLATINMASLLASQPVVLMEQWTYICDSLSTGSSTNSTSEGTRSVINLSYNNLTHYLKTCLLYLNMYPEGCTICKDDLVKQWVAEGFIGAAEGRDMEKVAESYFDELVGRRFLQPAGIKYNNEVVSCTVHDMVRDLIAYKSAEENFIMVVDYCRKNVELSDKVHRLSIHFGEAKYAKTPGNIRTSQVRSLSFFGLFKCMPSISEFKLLCILNLKLSGHNGEETLDLSGISELFQLRYFKVASDVCIELPKHMQGLQNLETLDIDTKVTDVPWDITHLPCLLHLHLPFETNLMDRIGSMRPANLQNLGKLTNLQDLRLTCSTPPPDHLERNVEALGSLLGGLGNLKTLALVCDSSHRNAVVHCPSEAIVSWDGITAALLLQRFEWSPCRGSFSRVPKWIGELHNLCILKIAVRELLMDGVDVLRGLPALTALSLYVQTAPVERIVFGKAGFSVLKYFKFRCSLPWLKFEEDAMPKLRKLKLVFNAHSADQNDSIHISIEHLSCLTEISAKIGAAGADPESVLTAAVINHPSNPIINVQFVDWILCGDEDIKKVGSKPAIMTEDAMVSAFTGSRNSLLVKLATLLGVQYAKLTADTRKEFMILKDELDAMKTLLEQLAGMAELSAQMRDSRNKMREMTYDIEDCIDDLMVHIVNEKVIGYPEKRAQLIIMLQNFTDQINKLKAQLEEADLRSMVPRTEMRSLGPSYMSREQWLSIDEGNGLVGMDGPRDELVRRLSGDKQEKLQGVCILGVAGIGKTMLATQVYNQIKRRFHRCVFISASKKVDMARLCRSILLQLQETINSNDVQYLIDRVRTNLQDKRFLIVIDGVWSAQIVEDIKVALPENNRSRSRIITTSGISDVAESCGKHFSSFIYPMKPLTFEESLGLFRSIIFGSGRSCPVASEKVDEEIVKACGGIPLALRLIAGALASKPAEMEQWVTFREKIMKQAGRDDHLNVEWMRQIFDISYSDLSCDMKTCLLYLSAFPENHVIRKDHLIRRWVAEGFLLKRCGRTWWETGESYFLELVARNLVNPVYDEEDVLPIGCKVSGSVRDFITSLSSEENFVKSDVTDPTCMQHGVFRRLSVDLGSDNQEKPLDLFQGALSSKVRSLTFVDDFGFGGMPDLSAFKHVRVLDLKDNKLLENEQLESIGRLSLLRYLGLGGTNVTELPQQIMALEQLTTLDIRRTSVRKLPEFRDTKLVFLLADELIIPKEMGGMQKLEELSKVLMGPDVAGLVNKLRRLRMLGVRFSRWYARNQQEVKHFVEEVGKSNLQSLFLDNYPHHLLHLLADLRTKRPHHLREIELRIAGCLPLVPKEMASLIALTHLHINVKVVGAQGVRALGNLPNLVLLKLVCSYTGVPRLAVSSKDGFQCLKVFCYWSGGMGLQFEAGAMPQLRRLVLDFNVQETISKYGDFDFGVQHLSYLVQVRATVDCTSATPWHVEAAEANMRDQVSQNPNHPVLDWKTRPAPAEGSLIAIHGLDEWTIQIETNKLVVIHFTEASCVPSLEMAPVFADLAKKFPNVVFLKVDHDVDGSRDIEEWFGVDGWPTFLFMKGGDVKDTLRGANKEELVWKLEVWE